EVHGELVFLSVINTFLSITAFLGNTLILVALRKDTSIHPSSKLLYRNLAITDLCVGIIAEPLLVAYWISVVNKRWDICHYADLTGYFAGGTLCSVSLITLTAISVDRLLALLLGLRYRQVVTLKRTRLIAIGGWIVSIIFGASTSFLNLRIVSLCRSIVLTFCLVTTIFAYTKIFMSLRHNQIHGQNHVFQGQSSQANTLNKARYRKAVYSALWVQVTLFICYLPFGIAAALTPQRGMPLSTYLALQCTATLAYLNSSLNPFLYCWKITEVRQAVHGELVFLSVVNTFLSITAFLGNTLILVALRNDTSIHPPSKLLYRNLAITDLCVGIIVEPLYVAHWTSVVNKIWDICYYTYLTAYFPSVTLCSVSLVTLTAISVDRLLALLLGLRYRQVVTLRRTHSIVIGGWIVSIVGASTSFLN
ncbi:unnamed protein product, partial [Porites lobata]